MTVCIVGNSDNVVGSNKGNLVDSCETVVRINDFLVDDHKDDVGSKITVIACAFSGANKIINSHNWPTRDRLKDSEIWMVRMPSHDRIERAVQCGLLIDNIRYPSRIIYDELVTNVYSKFWRKQPSSGLVTIAMAMNLYSSQKIFIHGFDDKTGKEGKRHYFDPDYFDVDRPNDPVGHDWESESQYIQKLVNNRRIYRL
jgi:hypothetical protein